jgi:hypothetical protein
MVSDGFLRRVSVGEYARRCRASEYRFIGRVENGITLIPAETTEATQ